MRRRGSAADAGQTPSIQSTGFESDSASIEGLATPVATTPATAIAGTRARGTPDLPALGTAVRAARLAAGIGLNDASRRLGCSGTTVSNIELGGLLATTERLQAMAALYGVPEQLDEWCRLAGRIPPDVAEILARPGMYQRVREMAAQERLFPPEAA